MDCCEDPAKSCQHLNFGFTRGSYWEKLVADNWFNIWRYLPSLASMCYPNVNGVSQLYLQLFTIKNKRSYQLHFTQHLQWITGLRFNIYLAIWKGEDLPEEPEEKYEILRNISKIGKHKLWNLNSCVFFWFN
mgnify:CR=1 FL=1